MLSNFKMMNRTDRRNSIRKSCREDSLGSSHHHHTVNSLTAPSATARTSNVNIDSLTYVDDESDAWRAHYSLEHYQHRGKIWNAEKHATLVRYALIAGVGVVQAMVAYFTNLTSSFLIQHKYSHIHDLLQLGSTFSAFLYFVSVQAILAMIASLFVWLEPVAAGSGIPEVKIYLVSLKVPLLSTYPQYFLYI